MATRPTRSSRARRCSTRTASSRRATGWTPASSTRLRRAAGRRATGSPSCSTSAAPTPWSWAASPSSSRCACSRRRRAPRASARARVTGRRPSSAGSCRPCTRTSPRRARSAPCSPYSPVCGIAGELRRGAAPDREALERMSAALAPRGPDGAGTWFHDGSALAHRRLAIIDLSDRGAQPMVDEELGLTVVFNGIVYNHRELRAELERAGHAFRSHADTEVLIKGWAEWGEGMLDRLAGMFAFCLVEHASGRAVLARDRLGKKPLYLQELGDGGLRIASSLPALVAGGGVDTRVDPVALHHYLSFHSIVPAPRTILRGVRKLPPATVMVVEPDGRRRERRYWDPPFERAHEDWSAREWEEAVLDALRLAVRRRMVSDVPVG